MSDIISDFLNNYGGDILNVGSQFLANQDYAKTAQGLNSQMGILNANSVGALKEGYQQALSATEGLTPTVKGIESTYENDANTSVNRLGTDNAAIAGQYSGNMNSTLGDAQAEYTTGAGNYAGDMTGALETSVPYLESGFHGMENTLSPYIEGGGRAHDYMLNTMGLDPSQLTPTQKLMYDKYHRDSVANLNASGLRGAGRSGVAAVNQGLADLDAKFYDTNVARADAAAGTLGQQGYGASGAVATGKKDMGQQLTQLNYDTGEKLANNAQRLGDINGELTYSTGKDVAGNTEGLAQKTADVGFNTTQNTAKMKLDTNTSLAAGLAAAKANTANSVAAANAQGYQNQALTASTKADIDNYKTGNTFNAISSIFSGAKKAPVV